YPFRMLLGIGERKGRAPAAAEDLPALDAELATQLLDVLDEVPGGVVHEVGVRGGAPGAALVEQHDAILRRVVETAHLCAAAAAGAAVQQHHRLAVRIAALLVVELVAAIDLEGAGLVGLDLGVQGAHAWLR